MPTTWIKMRSNLASDPAVLAMADALKLDVYGVVGRLQVLWAWADQHTDDGDLKLITEAHLDRQVNKRGFAAQLIAVGWLYRHDDGALSIPHFERHNGDSAKRRALKTEDKRRQRVVAIKDQPATTAPPAVAKNRRHDGDKMATRGEERREEERREESNLAPAGADAPADVPEFSGMPEPDQPPKKPRTRNPLLDALATCAGGSAQEVTPSAWGAIAKALSEIRSVSPHVDPDEIRRRAANYRTHMRDATLSATALAKHWSLCGDEHHARSQRAATFA